MPVEIISVDNHSQLVEFCNFPRYIYSRGEYPLVSGDPSSTFNPNQNPVMMHIMGNCFMAFRGRKPVGRIAAIKDTLNPDQETGFFGCFECLDDPEAAAGLIHQAYQWLLANGCQKMLGPATFNSNQQVGILIEGFERGYQPMMPFNPPYYRDLLESAGLVKLTDLLSFHWHREMGLPSKIAAAAARTEKLKGVTLRGINLFNPRADVELVREVYNKSMAANWGFVPLTGAEVLAMLNYCARSADPNLLLAVLVDNIPAGVLMFTPSPFPSRPHLKSVRAAILGVVPEFRHRGLDSLLMEQAINNLLRYGYDEADISQVHEDNAVMLKIIKKVLGAGQTRRFRIYQQVEQN